MKTRKKYLVFKWDDIDELPAHQQALLIGIAADIYQLRLRKGKINPDNDYIVINTDEPYIEEIINTMKKNGHWRQDE